MTTNDEKEPLEYAKEYLVAAGACALISGCFSGLILILGWGLSEFTNWLLSLAGVYVKALSGYTTALVMTLFIIMFPLQSPTHGRAALRVKGIDNLIFSGLISFGLIGFAVSVKVFEIVRLAFYDLIGCHLLYLLLFRNASYVS